MLLIQTSEGLLQGSDWRNETADIPTAVFLHGQKYTMETWEQLGTLKKVRDAGIRALAVDLPGGFANAPV